MGDTPGGMLLKLITGNGKQEKEHREPGTGKGGKGVREQVYSGNRECTAVTLLIIQRKKQGTIRVNVRKCSLLTVSFSWLSPQMTSTFLLEHSPIGSGITKHEMAPGEKIKSVLSQATPIGQTPVNVAKRSTR